MKNWSYAIPICVALVMPTASMAQTGYQSNVFHNPCERGPWPKVDIINDARASFIHYLLEVRPSMPYHTANAIADDLCGDMSLVGDSQGLTARLNYLIQRYGY